MTKYRTEAERKRARARRKVEVRAHANSVRRNPSPTVKDLRQITLDEFLQSVGPARAPPKRHLTARLTMKGNTVILYSEENVRVDWLLDQLVNVARAEAKGQSYFDCSCNRWRNELLPGHLAWI